MLQLVLLVLYKPQQLEPLVGLELQIVLQGQIDPANQKETQQCPRISQWMSLIYLPMHT